LFFSSKEKARLEEALLSESGQQQLAIRTFKVQLNKQNERLNILQMNVEQAQNKKEQTKNAALEVKKIFIFYSKENFLLFLLRLNNNMINLKKN
jgi:hypothetical protein